MVSDNMAVRRERSFFENYVISQAHREAMNKVSAVLEKPQKWKMPTDTAYEVDQIRYAALRLENLELWLGLKDPNTDWLFETQRFAVETLAQNGITYHEMHNTFVRFDESEKRFVQEKNNENRNGNVWPLSELDNCACCAFRYCGAIGSDDPRPCGRCIPLPKVSTNGARCKIRLAAIAMRIASNSS